MRSKFAALAALVTLSTASLAAGPGLASPDRAGATMALAPRVPASRTRALEATPPAVVTLESAGESFETEVTLRAFTEGAKPRVLGKVPHAAGAAVRGSLAVGRSLRAFVVAREEGAPSRSTYGSALFRVEEGAPVARLRGGLTNASRPLVTANGLVVVQAGRDGQEPEPEGKVLRERVDSLSLEVVDPVKGTSRVAWSGEGLIAFLAAPLAGDEALVFHVHARGASLFALDARRGSVRPLVPVMSPLARDFSYDRASDTIAFARANADRSAYEVVTLPARGGPRAEESLTVRYAGASDRLVPSLVPGGALALSLPNGGGLAWSVAPGASPSREAPLGEGVDEVLAASGSFVFLRHRTATDERTAVFDRTTRRIFQVTGPERAIEVAGFVAEGAR
jgi:hypothetical protein